MAFDATNAAHLATLKAAVESALTAPQRGSTGDVLAYLGEATATDTMNPLTKATFVGLLATYPNEISKAGTHAGTLVTAVVSLADDRDLTAFMPVLEAMLGADSAIVLGAKANTRKMTRAEALFGDGTQITRRDWIKARDS